MPDNYMDAVNVMWNFLGRARVMIGAKNQMGGKSAAGNPTLYFKIGRNAKKVTHISMELMPTDTYKVTFLNCRGYDRKVVAEFDDVYNNVILNLIRDNTGLDTSL
jgi:hypothetical protein